MQPCHFGPPAAISRRWGQPPGKSGATCCNEGEKGKQRKANNSTVACRREEALAAASWQRGPQAALAATDAWLWWTQAQAALLAGSLSEVRALSSESYAEIRIHKQASTGRTCDVQASTAGKQSGATNRQQLEAEQTQLHCSRPSCQLCCSKRRIAPCRQKSDLVSFLHQAESALQSPAALRHMAAPPAGASPDALLLRLPSEAEAGGVLADAHQRARLKDLGNTCASDPACCYSLVDQLAQDSRSVSGSTLPPSAAHKFRTSSAQVTRLCFCCCSAIKAGDHAAAVRHYTAALGMPRPPLPGGAAVLHANRGAAHQGAGALAEGIADCGRARALDPSYAKVICFLCPVCCFAA